MRYYIALFISILLGLTLELISLSNYLEPFRPHFLLMIVLFWLYSTKKQFSIGSAWAVGILMDIALIYPLGINGLTFAITAYITKRNNKWLSRLSITEISAAFAGFYILQIVLSLVINNMMGQTTGFNFWVFGSVVSSTLLWPLVYTLLYELCYILKITSR
ncbi:rod shape-determining protein MreD [Wohlfahrtiimonas larvae]|uniref:Rod shape-determining protein MreD n=1 Tax=Wohlfahrtiimonas larvae TaxID=1157986 RepID=A0ABP9MCT9_9GAMM|nr:rod shape-determining protein MreD [Wohlfahrtiimonas larvae]